MVVTRSPHKCSSMREALFSASATEYWLASFNRKRSMPEFISKSASKTRVFSCRDIAAAVFKATVDVPTPALAGRNENTFVVRRLLCGRFPARLRICVNDSRIA